MIKILFVCTGNICRSPTAESVMRKFIQDENLTNKIKVDSAGTHSIHEGEKSDSRSMSIAEKKGYSFNEIFSRPVDASDFEKFNLILAMDKSHYSRLKKIAPKNCNANIELFMDYAEYFEKKKSIPDPYYGGAKGFDDVLSLIETGVSLIIEKIKKS